MPQLAKRHTTFFFICVQFTLDALFFSPIDKTSGMDILYFIYPLSIYLCTFDKKCVPSESEVLN